MQIHIKNVAEIGRAVRATRRADGIRIDDMAGICKVSKQFASDLENGKPTIQLGLTLKVLADLGIRVILDMPDGSEKMFLQLSAKAAAFKNSASGE